MKWTIKPLAELAGFCLGKMLDEKKNRGELLPYLANINVRWGEFDLESLRQMRFEHDEMEQYGLKYGDIVMCEGGEPGRCALWKEPVSGMMIQKALHRIRSHDCLDNRFLYYSFIHLGRRGAFIPLLTGATIKHLPREKLAKVEIAFPRLEDQRRIADILSSYDDLIENNRRRMALLEETARQIYQEWFVRLRFPGHEHTSITNGVPEGWHFVTLDQVCVEGDGIQTGPFGSQLHQSDYTEDGVPVVMPKDLIDLRISEDSIARIPEELADKLGRHRMLPGDTVYGRRGDIGRRAFIRPRQAGWLCGTGCLRIRPYTGKVNDRYLFDTLGSPQTAATIANRAKGSTMPNLSAGALKSVPILLAPRMLQDMYALQVEASIDLRETLSEQNGKLRAARNLLLPRLMSGEIAV